MNGKAVIPLVAGLCIGGFALKIGFDTLRSAKAAPAATVQIWSAKDDIPRGEAITEEMLKAMGFPASAVPKGAFKDKKTLLGRVPRIDAPAGLPVLEDMLTPPGTPPGIMAIISKHPGFRAVAVKIDESSGVDYHLEPGGKVDVIGYFQQQRNGKPETVARTLIENVEVIAVGAKMSAAESDKPTAGPNKPARAVTLLVRQEDVPKLHLAEQKGKIKLAMRGDDDVPGSTKITHEAEVFGNEDPDADSADKPSLFGALRDMLARKEPEPAAQPAAPPQPVVVPAPPPQPAFNPDEVAIVVVHGDKREVVRFKNKNSRERVDTPEAKGRRAPQPDPAQPETPVSTGGHEPQAEPRTSPHGPSVPPVGAPDDEKPSNQEPDPEESPE